MKEIAIESMEGIYIGQAQDHQAATGCTVIIAPQGASAGVDVRGGAPATRETDLLKSENMVQKIHSVILSGGSAFGLQAAQGVMDYLEQHDIGFDMKVARVPIVVGASLFDLTVGDAMIRPDRDMGYLAAKDSQNDHSFLQGNYGAGTGASVGKMNPLYQPMKGGIGAVCYQYEDLQVGAIITVNAVGNVIDEQGNMIAGMYDQDKQKIVSCYDALLPQKPSDYSGNTTIGCIITNAALDKSQCNKIASMAHDGFARAIDPVHTMNDGDSLFTMATGQVSGDVNIVGMLAIKAVSESIRRAIYYAKGDYGLKSYQDLKKE